MNDLLHIINEIETRGRESHAVIDVVKAAPFGAGKLAGLTFAVKSNMAIAGFPVTLGLQPALLPLADRAANVVQKLEGAGARCVAITNSDELCADFTGKNRYFGDMRNPLNPALSALGSSAGSAIVVQQGLCDFALGTDFGGSVRAPAAACGTYGLRLAHRDVDTQGVYLFSPVMDAVGLFSRTRGLLEKILNSLDLLTQNKPPGTLTFFTPHAEDCAELSAEYAALLQNVHSRASTVGTLVTAPPMFKRALAARKVLATRDMVARLSEFKARLDTFPRGVQATFKKYFELQTSDFQSAELARDDLKMSLKKIAGVGGILLCPTLPDSPPPLDASATDITPSVPMNHFLALANLCDLPALSFPINVTTAANLPFSLQLISCTSGEVRFQQLCDVARALEQLF